MRKFNLMCLGLMAGATLAGCSDDALQVDDLQNEEYVKAFIERYGVPDPNHTYSMASRCGITLKTSSSTDVKITAFVRDKEYLFADLKGVKGTKQIGFDLPTGIKDVTVRANGRTIAAKVGDVVTINADGSGRAMSREDETAQFAWDGSTMTATRIATEDVNSTEPGVGENEDYVVNTIKISTTDETAKKYGNWWGTSATPVPNTYFKQAIKDNLSTSSANLKTVAQQISTATPGWNPTIWFKYIRPGVNFEFGVMIGSKITLSESAKSGELICIPIMSTGKAGETTQMFYRAQRASNENNFNMRGAQVDFYFNKESGPNVIVNHSMTMDSRSETWNFTDASNTNTYCGALKTAIENLADLYTPDASGNRTLPLPVDAKKGVTYINSEGQTVTLKAYSDFYDEDGNPKDGATNVMEFWTGFQGYLESAVATYKNAHPSDSKYDDLMMLKEWFSDYYEKPFFFTANDIPEVVRIKDASGAVIEGAYRVTYRMAKKADCVYKPTDVDFKTTFPSDDYIVTQSMSGGAKLTTDMMDNHHEYVLYFKNLDDNVIRTTAETQIYEYKEDVKYSLEGKPVVGNMGSFMDIDGNGSIDVVFVNTVTGPGGGDETPAYTWLMACEDLGSSDDFDFNDVVVAINHYTANTTVSQEKFTAYPVAAGGTYPAYLMFNEVDEKGDMVTYFIGPEIHKWLGGSDHTTMLYTREPTFDESLRKYSRRVEHIIVKPFSDSQGFSMSMEDIKNNPNGKSFAGFWVFVDKNNTIASSDDAAVRKYALSECKSVAIADGDVEKMNAIFGGGKSVVNNGAHSQANVPSMLILGDDWEWPIERTRIEEAYRNFGEWINNPSQIWYGIKDGKFVEGIERENVVKRKDLEESLTPSTK